MSFNTPFCHASVDRRGITPRPWRKLNHWSDTNSPAGSEKTWVGFPAQANHMFEKAGITCSRFRLSSLRPTWNSDASSIQWKTTTWKPAFPVQKKPSMPMTSLNSLGSCNCAGRWWWNAVDSTQASHTDSLAASTILELAPWIWRWAASRSGSGWPRFYGAWLSPVSQSHLAT